MKRVVYLEAGTLGQLQEEVSKLVDAYGPDATTQVVQVTKLIITKEDAPSSADALPTEAETVEDMKILGEFVRMLKTVEKFESWGLDGDTEEFKLSV